MFIGLYKLIRMFLATLRGSDTPQQLAFGIAFGMLIGIVPKDSLIVVFVGLLIVATNVNVLMATLSGFAFTWIGFSLEAVSHNISEYVLTREALTPTFARMYDTPIVPWTRFNDTIVCGSFLIGLLCLIPLYQFSRLFFTHLTPRIHQRLIGIGMYAWLSGANRDPEEQLKANRKRAVKWGWVMPRIAIVAMLIALVYFYQDRVIEYGIEQAGSAAVGAKVEIGMVKSKVAEGEFRLHDIRIANPSSPMNDAVRAKYAGFNLNTNALLKKKFVIEETKLVGVEFNSRRKVSGALPDRPRDESDDDNEPGFIATKAKELGKQMADGLKDTATQKLEENLQTVKISKQLIEYWPREYESLKVRADRLENKLKQLRELKELKFNNPLRDFQKYQDALVNINQTQQEIINLHQQLKVLRRKFGEDRKALLAAKEIDKQNINSLIKSSKISGKSLTEVLLGEEQGRRVEEILSWVRWMKETVPDPEKDFRPTRTLGREVLFPGITRTPDFLVERVMLTGKGTLGDDLYQFRGTVKNVTSDPKLHGKPTVINLSTLANTDLKIRAIIDQTKKHRSDTLLIHCPKIDLKPQRLGKENSFLVSVAPAKMDLSVKVKMIRNRIGGQIILKQSGVRMSLDQVPGVVRDKQVMAIIDQELAQLDHFDVIVNLSGKIDEPKWELESDLGNQMAGIMNNTMQRTVDHQVARLHKRVDRLAQKHLSQLNLIVSEKQAEIQHMLDKNGIDIADLQAKVKQVMDLPLLRR